MGAKVKMIQPNHAYLGPLRFDSRYSSRHRQQGTILVIGLIILGISFILVIVGTHSMITMEKISSNAQQRSVADSAAESVVIQTINDEDTITLLVNEARNIGKSTERAITVSLPNPDQTGSAAVTINTRPTIGYSADTLTTYNITVQADAENIGTKSEVRQTFMRIGAK
jgi:Tfp pilus assembly protein PilX